jgi:anti-sigma regulatory factor (Ser/Thr protein kinase)
MAKTDGASAVRLSVPARADVVYVVRAAIGGAAALHGASYELIQDLRLSADEACAHLLHEVPHGSRLVIELAAPPGAIEVIVAIDGDAEEWPTPNAQESLAWYVLSALADGAEFLRWEGNPAIRFSTRLNT